MPGNISLGLDLPPPVIMSMPTPQPLHSISLPLHWMTALGEVGNTGSGSYPSRLTPCDHLTGFWFKLLGCLSWTHTHHSPASRMLVLQTGTATPSLFSPLALH